jgi:integrase
MMQPQQFKILNYQKDNESNTEVTIDSIKDIDRRKLRKKRTRRKIPSVYTREHLVKLFTAIDNPNLAIACAISLFCGLRIAEVCKLKWMDIDLEKRELKVICGKGSKDRYSTIPEQLIPILTKYKRFIGNNEWLFPSQKGNLPKRATTIAQEYMKALDDAKLHDQVAVSKHGRPMYKYSFHTLRHTYATYLLEKGVELLYIQKALGHSDMVTTQIYAHVSNPELRKRVDEAFSGKVQYQEKLSPKLQKASMMPSQLTLSQATEPLQVLKLRLVSGEIGIDRYHKLARIIKDGI